MSDAKQTRVEWIEDVVDDPAVEERARTLMTCPGCGGDPWEESDEANGDGFKRLKACDVCRGCGRIPRPAIEVGAITIQADERIPPGRIGVGITREEALRRLRGCS